jgi:hypothetical protein
MKPSDADAPANPCGQRGRSGVISNPAGLAFVAYRVGDYVSFREALLSSRAGENALAAWRPGASGDLAVQMVEWWAYLADVLTFYNELTANQTYLRTASLPESVNRLIRLLGYRPRPGIGATGVLGALSAGAQPFTLPKGFQIQSKPGPGQQPQVFELDSDVTITPPLGPPASGTVQGAPPLKPAEAPAPVPVESGGSVLLAGAVTAVKVGDRVLLLPLAGLSPKPSFALATVAKVGREKDARGNGVTRVSFAPDNKWTAVADATQYHILRSDQSVQVWQYPADAGYVIAALPGALQIHLASLVRSLKVGDGVVMEGADPSLPQFGLVTASTEALWYANAPETPVFFDPNFFAGDMRAARPKQVVSKPALQGEGEKFLLGSEEILRLAVRVNPAIPPDPPTVPISVPHTRITIGWTATAIPPDDADSRTKYLLRYGWKEVGPLIALPAAAVGGGAGPLTLVRSDGATFAASETSVLVEDANGRGAVGAVQELASLQLPAPAPLLVPPLRALVNMLPVSRGQAVAHEVLGSGNALAAGQDFVLQKAPVTYLQSPNSTSGDNYASTVRVRVNGVEWSEVRFFYGQPANAQVFITREDDQGQTHVVFGDGRNGARLPTGVNNLVASYRHGSGSAAPAAGSLTAVLKPLPGLRAVRNPVAVGGGSDPDPPDKLRRSAPRSLLTFNRAISVADFEAIAAHTPGVVRAKAAVTFDPEAQRPRVVVWVGDDQTAVESVQAAFAAAADPNRLPRVVAAKAVVMTLRLTVLYDPRRDADAVRAAVHAALIDPDAGLLGLNVVGIGQVFFDSQVHAACLAVPGVTGVRSLRFSVTNQFLPPIFIRDRVFLREVLFRRFLPEPPPAAAPCTGQRHDPGEGAFLFLPDNPGHFFLALEAAP